MTRDETIGLFTHVTETLKWRSDASNLLTRVRSISESDMRTLERVIEDYQALIGLAYELGDYKDREQLSEKYQGALPEVLRRIIDRAGKLK